VKASSLSLKKVSAILAILPPENVKELRSFLGVVQYYRDIWRRRLHLVSPVTDLVAECGKPKKKKRNPKSGTGLLNISRLLKKLRGQFLKK